MRLKWNDEKIIQHIEENGYIFIRFIDEKDGIIYNRKGFERRIEIWCGNPNHKSYEVKFGNFVGKNKRRCPYCNGGIKYTYEYVKEYIESFGYKLLEDNYINARTKMNVMCDKGHMYKTTFDNFITHKCPKCSFDYVSNLRRKSQEQFEKELFLINKNIEIISEYKSTNEYVECKCKLNNSHIWKATPHNLLKGSGCPHCKKSKGEEKIKDFLLNKHIKFEQEYEFEDCFCRKSLPFDFYLPQYNIAIEYDGEQHYKIIEVFGGLDRFIDQKIKDTIKTWYCEQNNIQLIRIPYWEFNNIEKILEDNIE